MWYLNTDKTTLTNLSLAQTVEFVGLDNGNARVTAKMNDNTNSELFSGGKAKASDVFLKVRNALAGASQVI